LYGICGDCRAKMNAETLKKDGSSHH
jgi:hypothetical protein